MNKKPLVFTLITALIIGLLGTFSFFKSPAPAQAAWYTAQPEDGSWNYRQKITIDHTKVSNTDQTDFPVLIKIANENNPLFTKAQADGDDILFTQSDETTKLSHEIEKFTVDTGNRELIAWVKIPTLSATTDTIIYLYYGNPSTSSGQAPTDVWSNGYVGVWHMNDNADNSTVTDSIGVNNGSAQQNTDNLSSLGRAGGALSFNGTSDYVERVGNRVIPQNGNFTVSAWLETSNIQSNSAIFSAGQISNLDIILYAASSQGTAINQLRFFSRNPNQEVLVGSDIRDTGWRLVTLTRNLDNFGLYVDNSLNSSATSAMTVGTDFIIGAAPDSGNTRRFLANGLIDNMHVSSVARSADWIATEYANQNDPTTFYSLEAEATGDIVAPTNPTDVDGYSDSGMGTPIISANFYNYPTPYFEWSGAEDTGNTYASGVAGYYSYFGTSCGTGGGNPTQSRGILSDTGGGLHYSTDSNITIPDLGANEGTYCLRLKTADNAGNIQSDTWEAYSAYKYEITAPISPTFIAANPAGYSSVDSFQFSWPVAGDTINAYASGLAGYQYMRGDGSNDDWSATISTSSINNVTSYQTGENIFLVRSVDMAGNVSAPVQTTYYYSDSAPTKPTGLTATPNISDTNSFAFSWTAPEHTRPIVDYGYSINAAPTLQNIIWTNSNTASLPAAPYAAKQGVNTLYLLAKDDSGAYSLDQANYATVDFNCTTPAPPIPTAVSIKDSSNRVLMQYSLDIQWKAGVGQDDTSFDHYSVERSVDGITFAEVDIKKADDPTSYSDTVGLNGATLYYYRIKAVDNAGSISAPSTIVSKTPTFKYDAPPTIVTEPIAIPKSTNVTISWVVDRASKSSIRFGVDKDNLSDSRSNTTTETNHRISLTTGLLPGTRYYYQVQSLDALRDYSLESAYSDTYYFDTISAPSIANVSVSNITLGSADITWETTSASNTKVYYGGSINYGFVLPEVDDSMTTQHSVKLQNLAHTTRYHFKIYGDDIDGNTLSSDDYVFDTLPMPTISTIEAATDFSGPAPVVNITWLTNVPTTSSVEYTPQEAGDSVVFEESQSALVERHKVTLSNLLNDNLYQFTVSGTDQFGNKTVSDSQVLKTNSDSRPPKISNIVVETSNVGLGSKDEARIVVYWETDEPATAQVSYDDGLSGTEYTKKTAPDLGLTKNHIVVITGLKPGAPYHLRVISKDEQGNPAECPDQAIVTGQVAESVLSIISRTLSNAFGWMTR